MTLLSKRIPPLNAHPVYNHTIAMTMTHQSYDILRKVVELTTTPSTKTIWKEYWNPAHVHLHIETPERSETYALRN